ncbi:MAG: hypothetical protein GY941_20285 [Planctomycetes bacterium]|nr:hypothetical protein [Planctomycetota bacterium]
MEILRKFVIGVFGVFICMGMTILTMIKGYGLTINSWPWLIGGTVLSLIIGQIIAALVKP